MTRQEVFGNGRSRLLEDAGFVAGLLVGLAYVVVAEILAARACADHAHGFPWGVAFVMGVCVAPKMLGRATAGRIWDRLAGKKADG